MITPVEDYVWGAEWSEPMPYQIIPMEYQGYMFLAFMIISFILICYMFYMIATDPRLEEK